MKNCNSVGYEENVVFIFAKAHRDFQWVCARLCFIRLKYKILSATRISHLTEELIKFCSKEKFNLFYNLYHSQHF